MGYFAVPTKSACVKGFGCRPYAAVPRRPAASRPKPSKGGNRDWGRSGGAAWALWRLYERGTVKPDFWALFHFHSFFCST